MSTASDVAIAAAGPVVRLLADIFEGRIREPGDIAKSLVGIAFESAPVEDLRGYLEDEARKRQDAAFELAEDVKYGPKG